MAVILTTAEQHAGQELKIYVKYDAKENVVLEIKSVFIGVLAVGSLLTNIPEMDVALNKIIDRVDWREIFRNQQQSMQDAA